MNNRLLDVGGLGSNDDKISAIQGLRVVSWEDCARGCCMKADCEFISFKMTETSRNGHNCYLINCGGYLDNCLSNAVHQYGFVSMGVGPEKGEHQTLAPKISGEFYLSFYVAKTKSKSMLDGYIMNDMMSLATTETPADKPATNSSILETSASSQNTTDIQVLPPEEHIRRCSGMQTSMGCFSKIWVGVIGMVIICVVVVTAVVLFFVVRKVRSRRKAANKKSRRL